MRILLIVVGILASLAVPGWSQCGAASMSARNGAGLNPSNLSANHAPILGQTFLLELDCTGVVPPQNGFALLQGRLSTTAGLMTRAGEVLVDLGSPLFHRQIELGSAGIVLRPSWVVPPNDPSLCGLPITFQGLCSGGGTLLLSNAIDVRVGL